MRERARSKMATLDAGHTAQHGSSGRSPSNRSISDRLGLAAMQPFPSVRRIRRLSVHDRSNSDSNLAHPDLQRRAGQQSSLMVSKNEIILGGEYGDSASVNVHWDIREDVGSQDWIGLYLIGERNPASYLSYKNRGVSGTHKGQIIWIIDAEPNFTKPLTKVCFKYYHGATGELRACTSTINIKNLDVWDPESDDELDEYDPYIKLTLSGVKAEGLKKGIIFNPHPYIKFSIQTRRSAKDQPPQRTNDHHHHHHNHHHSNTHQHQQQRTTIAENTVMPTWQGQEFTFNVTRVDVLEIEVKDKFNRSHPVISRFLGKLSIPVQRLIEKVALGEHTVTYSLNKRHPSDHVSGYLTFTVNMEEVPEDHPIPNGDMGGHPEVIDMTRSASFPVSLRVSGDASVESSPRHSIISEELENAHNSVARSSSAPSHTVNHQREPKAIHVPPIEPPTPTDNVSAPISNEQWSQATQDMSERSLDQVESISCMYSLHGAGDGAARKPQTTVTTSSGTNGESIHRPLTIHIPGVHGAPALVSSIGTQVTPSPTSRPPVSLVNEAEQRTALEGNQNEAADSVDINVTPPEENVVAPSSPLEASSRHSMSAPMAVSRRRSTDDGESVRPHPSLSPCSSLPNSLSRSPEGRHRALSDILLKQQIDEEVQRLRSRSSLSNSESSPQQSEQNSESGSSQSNVTSPTTPFSSSAIRANGTAVERTSADSAVTEPDTGSDSSPSSEQKEQSSVDSPDGAACSRSHTRNNNNSLSQGASENAVPVTIAGSVNGDSSREAVRAVTNGPGSTEEQTPSVNGESKSSPEGSSTASTPAASSSREDVVPPMGTQTSAPPAGSRTRRRSSHRNSAVWQKRQGLRAAAAGLHVTIPGATSESSGTDSPTTPVLTPGHRNTYQRYVLPAEEDPLPENWEARIDQYGRVFYIDHQSRATTWTKPGRNQTGRHPRDTRASEQSRQQLDRRYQSIRRTLQSDENESRRNSSEGPSASSSSESIPHIQNPRNHQSLMESPAVLFITRPDFFNFLHSNADAKNTFQKNSSVKHMVNRIRRDPGKFADYQHNRDLVALLNSFADPRADLPRGWETKKDKSGKDFFIDHNNRATSFIDPRLPLNIVDTSGAMLAPPRGRIRSRSEGEDELQNSTYAIQAAHNSRGSRGSGPPPVVPRPVETLRGGSSRSEEVPMAYNEKVVAFLRQPNIMDILVERQPGLGANQKLKDKLVAIRKDGIEALETLSNDMELIMLLSLFEENIMSYMPNPQQANALRSTLAQAISPQNSPQHSPHSSPVVGRANARAPAPYKRDFDAKLRNFYRKLEAKGFGQGPTKLKLTIRRDHLLEDAFGKIMAINKKDIQKCKLFICFAGEEGLDYGGPSREFFFLLSRELFNPYYGLFEYSAIDTYTVQISPMSAFVDNYLEWFRFCGRVIGLAIIHHFLLDAFFTRPFYKALLRQLCNLTDLESLDSEFYRSLLWVKDNDITDQLDLTFTADEEVFGQLTERELKPNGKNIAVTEKNKKEYIEKMVRWRIERGVSEQTESLVRGFYEVVDSRLVSVFDARELELVIAGTAEIDVADWRRNTEYRGGYHDKHHVINWFWMAVERFDNERRLRLLQFVTGTSSIPYEGFAALRGSNGPRKFCIEKWGKNSFLPRAHTCFNRLDLPAYPNYAMLMEKLVIAVEETSTFGID